MGYGYGGYIDDMHIACYRLDISCGYWLLYEKCTNNILDPCIPRNSIALVAYLTYETFHRSKYTLFRVLAAIVLMLALIQVVTGILARYPGIHGIVGLLCWY
jgi:hypothetical protein